MFHKVFLEKEYQNHPRVLSILSKIKNTPILIERIEDSWGRSKKPYLQKRETLSLYIGAKRGQLVKEAPQAYGTSIGHHYYFIHAYNCIYECQYCYLQGYFDTPDLVIFVNHEDMIAEIDTIYKKHQKENPGVEVWFHAGEFSDSLALSHITDEWATYWEYFQNNEHAYLELRTKSVNTKAIEALPPAKNIITTFSLSPTISTKEFDLKTPSLSARLKALDKLIALGHHVGLHFDPIIYAENFESEYLELAKNLSHIPCEQLHYISLGVVRFTKDVYRQVEINYPDSAIHAENFIKSFDNKVRYSKPMRMWMMTKVKEILIQHNFAPDKIYLCME